jgi:predicted glycosyltransferase
MKIVVYCQHVLGIGHFFRILEICRSLDRHDVVLVTGGEPVDVPLPPHVREVRLGGLMMTPDFSGVYATARGGSVERVQAERKQRLWSVMTHEKADIFLVELYPFGRKAFRFELDPVLKGLGDGGLPSARAVCSLRDILVEKRDQNDYEKRVVKTLNARFDILLVHADPRVIRLEDTFSRVADISIPVHYTGYVAPRPSVGRRQDLRRELGIASGDPMVVASAGGGKVGAPLLQAVLDGFERLNLPRAVLFVFTGPYLEAAQFDSFCRMAGPRICVRRFTRRFIEYVAAADLSISMAGYNTCMNILTTGTAALVWPFVQNREQRLRAERLQQRGALRLLAEDDLDGPAMAGRIRSMLMSTRNDAHKVDLEGARRTAQILEQMSERAHAGDDKEVP